MTQTLRIAMRFGLYGLILSGVACTSEPSADASPETEDLNPAAETTEQSNLQVSPWMNDEMSFGDQISGAIADLAGREQIAEDKIQLTQAGMVEWGSSALGCPQPDMNYTQAVVPGLWVVLSIDERRFYYHGAEGKALFLCPADRMTAPISPPKTNIM